MADELKSKKVKAVRQKVEGKIAATLYLPFYFFLLTFDF